MRKLLTLAGITLVTLAAAASFNPHESHDLSTPCIGTRAYNTNSANGVGFPYQATATPALEERLPQGAKIPIYATAMPSSPTPVDNAAEPRLDYEIRNMVIFGGKLNENAIVLGQYKDGRMFMDSCTATISNTLLLQCSGYSGYNIYIDIFHGREFSLVNNYELESQFSPEGTPIIGAIALGEPGKQWALVIGTGEGSTPYKVSLILNDYVGVIQ